MAGVLIYAALLVLCVLVPWVFYWTYGCVGEETIP